MTETPNTSQETEVRTWLKKTVQLTTERVDEILWDFVQEHRSFTKDCILNILVNLYNWVTSWDRSLEDKAYNTIHPVPNDNRLFETKKDDIPSIEKVLQEWENHETSIFFLSENSKILKAEERSERENKK